MISGINGKILSSDAWLCEWRLTYGLLSAGCSARIKKRGHFGFVLRMSAGDAFLFDLLPAQRWVKVYFSSHANKIDAFAFPVLLGGFPEAIERPRDGVVSINFSEPERCDAFLEYARGAISQAAKGEA